MWRHCSGYGITTNKTVMEFNCYKNIVHKRVTRINIVLKLKRTENHVWLKHIYQDVPSENPLEEMSWLSPHTSK